MITVGMVVVNQAHSQARAPGRLMALLEQVATVDESFRELRRQRSAAFLARNARAVRRLQRAGLADPDPGANTSDRYQTWHQPTPVSSTSTYRPDRGDAGLSLRSLNKEVVPA
jgi:hypothetical protein